MNDEKMYAGKLPILALRGLAVFPDQTVHFDVGRSKSVLALEAAMKRGKKPEELQKSIEKHLADGPGKMCIAMGIDKADNAVDMIGNPDFYVTEGRSVKSEQVKCGKRIGIDYAEEAADYLWRFYL